MSPTSRFVPVLVVCAAAAAIPIAAAQQGGDVRTRQIYVSALDQKGVPLPDLTPADFVVREDGQVREVLEAKIADEPLQVALLIDDSQAANEATTYLREGLTAFLERLHGKAETALITFGDRPTVLAPYTKDTEQLQARVRRIFPRPSAGAYLLDAIIDASRGLAKREAKRPVIVVVSFEGIEYSNAHSQPVLDELRKSGAALHAIVVGTPTSSLNDEIREKNIVLSDGPTRTGGRRDQVLALSGLPDKLKQAADELTHQYVLTYGRPERLVPPEEIEVTSTRRNVTVRARTRAER